MPLAGILTALLLLVLSVSPALSHAANNITAILAEFSLALTFTRLADDFDARNTITVLAVDDANMAPLMARRLPRDSLRRVLSLHVLVDYYDDAKLHRLPGGSAVVSTLFQASGNAPGSAGMVRIADRRGGRVAFVPQDADDDARAAVFYVRPVRETAYNISVLQVSAVISSPASSPEPRPNVTDVMSRKRVRPLRRPRRRRVPGVRAGRDRADDLLVGRQGGEGLHAADQEPHLRRPARPGVVHIIDGVLLPPEGSPAPWYGGIGPVVGPAGATSF